MIARVGYAASVGRPKGLSGDARRTAILDAAEVEFGLRGLNFRNPHPRKLRRAVVGGGMAGGIGAAHSR